VSGRGYRVVAAWPGLRVGDRASLETLMHAASAVQETAPRAWNEEWTSRTSDLPPGRADLQARSPETGETLAAFAASTRDDPPHPDGFANFLSFATSGNLPDRVEREWSDRVFDAFVRTPARWVVLDEAHASEHLTGPEVRAGLRTKTRATTALPPVIPDASVRRWDPFVLVDVLGDDPSSVARVDAVLRRAGCLEPLPTLAQSGHAAADCPGITASCAELAIDTVRWRRLFRCRWCGTFWERAEGVPASDERVDATRAAADFPAWDGDGGE